MSFRLSSPLTLALVCTAAVVVDLATGGSVLAAERPATPAPADAPAASALPPGSAVVARVDGTELLFSDVEAAKQSLPPQAQKMRLEQIYPVLLDRLVDGMLITEAGRKEHLDQDPELQRRLKRLEDRLIQEAYLNRAIKTAETEEALKTAYQSFVKDKAGREEVHARHILVKSEDQAKSVIGELDKGADFAELAKKYSTDPGAASGGDLGYFGHDDMVKEFADAAFALPAGQYTKTPVKTQFGWHVIKVEDHRVGAPPSFEEARPQITQIVAHNAVEATLKQLRSAANIETFGLDGKPLPAA
ncbi:MAG TPA: peptidylprolyl isomerase, partial [Stellaceae bacterium]|nr:peptidylprolyl isomerase [Stellaceae bacterium]